MAGKVPRIALVPKFSFAGENFDDGSLHAMAMILMDYFNTVVHVFHPETRDFYELEHLWSDAKVTEFGEV